MCDYVDAGDEKECSDEKIRGTVKHRLKHRCLSWSLIAIFRQNLSDVHCQSILFGGTSDNGYARLLGPFVEDETVRKRIVLLEGPPFSRDLAKIKDSFRKVSFENIFRNQKLPQRQVSYNMTPPGTPGVDYAKAASKAPSFPTVIPTLLQGSALSERPTTIGVLRNIQGQRVDQPLSYSQQDFYSLKNRKLCNNFYLLGRCHYQEEFGSCQHDHEAKLSDRQKSALRAVARQSYCQEGLSCSNLDCLHGHRCTRNNCSRTNCWFPREMHNVDTKVVSTA